LSWILLLQAPAQFSRVFWFLSHTCPLVQTKGPNKNGDSYTIDKSTTLLKSFDHLLYQFPKVLPHFWELKIEPSSGFKNTK
jgi:hypothetical protein